MKEMEGTWPKNSVQRAFVEGAKWWQFYHNGSTMFPSERDKAEAEAVERYGRVRKWDWDAMFNWTVLGLAVLLLVAKFVLNHYGIPV